MQSLKDIDGALLKEIIMSMQIGKTCSEDLVVAEMLQSLDDDILDVLADLFKLRLINHTSEDSAEAWAMQNQNLIKKKVKAVQILQFRPIAILPVI